MNHQELEHYRKLLLDIRRAIVSEMSNIKSEEEDSTLKDEDGDHSAYPYHMADQGSDSIAQEMNFFFAHRDSRFLYHIDAALDRIEDGTYGICEICQEEISKDRLDVLPHARFCITCKTKEESMKVNQSNSRGNYTAWVNDDIYESY